eukprot:scaffold44781_cov43-Phaeocystis_antarctica.AAC.1
MSGLFTTSGLGPSFNEDVSSWDTSSVTTMSGMFNVRPARASPPMSSWVPPCILLAPPPPTPARLPLCMSPPMSHLLTRQEAAVFNQPLSFDTSSVRNMLGMFLVRLARASSSMSSWVLPARYLHRRRPTPS